MPVICPKCRLKFGNLENRIGSEFYNVFGELARKYKCPDCGEIFVSTDNDEEEEVI